MKLVKGFTLIEVLIALSIFAVLATITASALYNAFNTRAIINKQADQLNQLQLAISLIEKDSKQVIQRPIRSDGPHWYPAFSGNLYYVEFTRDGVSNPLGYEKRSSLKRIALVCKNHRLIRRSWAVLDPLKHDSFEDKLLLDNLQQCQFHYLDRHLQLLSEWRADNSNQRKSKQPFPTAIQLKITHSQWGRASLLFIIPEGLYRYAS